MTLLRKILVSVKFLSAILGPEMAAPILWTPGKMRSFCRKTNVHKIPRFRGGGYFGFWGGSADFIFMGARIFENYDAHGLLRTDTALASDCRPQFGRP